MKQQKTQEYEARKRLEKTPQDTDAVQEKVRIIQDMSALLQQYEQRIAALEQENAFLKNPEDLTEQVRSYKQKALQLLNSQSIDHAQRESLNDSQTSLSYYRPSSKNDLSGFSAQSSLAFMSPIKPQESAQFAALASTPPTFREYSTMGDRDAFMIDSLAEIKARLGALQENKEELTKRNAGLEAKATT